MYPLPQSPIPTTSGFVPYWPSSTFKPIHPAAPSTASGPATQGSLNTLLGMVDSTQETGSYPGSSIPCAQKSPANSQPSPVSTQGSPLSLIVHKYHNHNHKMLHKVNLLQQTHKHFSSHLLHPSNSHRCYSPQFKAHMLHQCSRVSHNLCNLG